MSIYRNYSPDQVEDLLSNYLIDSWSYSRVSTFARQEKEFEMRYLYNVYSKSSATSVAGQAYHKALELYFGKMATGEACDIIDMQLMATDHINSQPADSWKIQKTRPTVQSCIDAAIESSYKGIENFLKQIEIYTDEIEKILGVELSLTEWLTVNGVDIPLPCNMKIDLVVLTKDGKRAIVDHKLRGAFTPEEEINFTIGKQAITYALGYEAHFDEPIDEVWFVENKISKNKDGSPQLVKNKVILDNGTRRLYEAMLYEPLKRMIEAVSDPDHVYIINDNDSFTSKAELYEFWANTMIQEIEAFNISEKKKPLMEKRRRKIRDSSLTTITPNVVRNFKKYTEQFIPYDFTNKDMTTQEKIEHVLRSFGIVAQVQHTFEGFSSNTYLLEIGAGVAVTSIMRYRLDIANALNQPNVRIGKELTVYNGRSYLSIESGKKATATLMYDSTKLVGKKIPLGIDNLQQTIFWDLDNQSTPHMLVCGATGCLSADTNISVHIPHYKRKNKIKTIETLYKIQNGKPSGQTWLVNKDKKEMLVRCLDESTGTFTYTPFEVVYSGKKQCFYMTTENGKSIECTADHRFLTEDGWRKLSELKKGDSIMYRPSVREYNGKQKQIALKDVFVKFHPRNRVKTVADSGKPYKYFRVPYHHFIYEANQNGLTFDEYKNILNDYDGRDLFFVPKGYQIDHIDGDRNNNDPSNLQMLSISDHAIKTVGTANGVFGYFRPEKCKITSIIPTEIKDTYDICCIGNNHNFIANGLIVHNSGKSVCIKSTIKYALQSGINDIYIFDPKYEFTSYAGNGITVVNDISDIETQMGLLVLEMEERVRYGSSQKTLVIFDEFADAVANSRKGSSLNNYSMEVIGYYKNGKEKTKRIVTSVDKSLEENMRVLLQKGRSSGFRILAATQRASVKVITGDAKVNFPVQVCFRVPKDIDSIVVIDEPGAESLNGRGDGLIKSPEYGQVVRFQGFYTE